MKSIILTTLLIVFFSITGYSQPDSVYYQAKLNQALRDPNTNSYFKKIYERNAFIPSSNDRLMLSILDSLFSSDTNKRFFYFMVFTKSMNRPNSFYLEAARYTALKFVRDRPTQFGRYFCCASGLTEKDFDNWGVYVHREISVMNRGTRYEAMQEFFQTIRYNSKYDRGKVGDVITSFIDKIEEVQERGRR